ncbi:toprim domain-containing protein [Spiroplasma taiwanense]|uniref:Recombination protein RecR n=1 Tax=Spiroplasma taiwanense CT-1 TaxID=1276220 RepID=S5MFS2_9MOLU|nr:toprim domain-containing protein [Spiroplasma taiwanense]AGR40705.1 recombination protein RecR [Spiroplasma taiwanense CT-1]
MEKLIEYLKNINGISSKSAEKIIFDLIINKNKLLNLEEFLKKIKLDYDECGECFFYRENRTCLFCDNDQRDKKIICVVSTKIDAKKILNSNYKGIIHVLNGEINLNKNIDPEKLTLNKLFARINMDTELLLALNLTFEGEVTANFIYNKVKSNCSKISRIARGIPLGGVLDYIDQETLNDAILNRKKF